MPRTSSPHTPHHPRRKPLISRHIRSTSSLTRSQRPSSAIASPTSRAGRPYQTEHPTTKFSERRDPNGARPRPRQPCHSSQQGSSAEQDYKSKQAQDADHGRLVAARRQCMPRQLHRLPRRVCRVSYFQPCRTHKDLLPKPHHATSTLIH